MCTIYNRSSRVVSDVQNRAEGKMKMKICCTHYTAKTTQPHLLQVVNFTDLLQLVNKLQQACQFHQVVTDLLKSGLLQLVICRLVTTCLNNLQQACMFITRLDNQFAASPSTICNRFIVNKLSQAMRTHPDIGLL